MSMVRYMMLAAVLFALPSQAAPIDMDRVRAAAEHWIDGSAVFRQAAIENAGPYVCDVVTPLRTSDENKVMAYHVSLKPVGYVVVSADARMFPVLCFSTASDLDLSDSQGNALRRLLFDDLDANERVLTQWDEAASLQSAMEPALAIEHRRAWEALLAGRQFLYDPTNILVDVLLETRWSQWNHYNELCPVDPAPAPSYDGRVPVGCVAAAGSQLMKYYEWPPHGWGGHSYTDSEPTVTGAHSAVFSDPYDWDNMLTSYDAYGYVPLTQELAVSELIYEVGVSVEMDYGSYYNDNGSGASSDDLGSALSTYFFYEQHAYMNRSNNPAAFDQMM
ncbi:MAG: hypothetical protein EOM20_17015, partial [Spartobacteria bacterium]|nr:hypothetical protein [Spartobacteria bacterium]